LQPLSKPGQRVSFEIGESPRTGRTMACRIELIGGFSAIA
jgi:cold shock CspA family protein